MHNNLHTRPAQHSTIPLDKLENYTLDQLKWLFIRMDVERAPEAPGKDTGRRTRQECDVQRRLSLAPRTNSLPVIIM